MKNALAFLTLLFLFTSTNLHADEGNKNEKGAQVYELRIYSANEGKLDALNARFRNHTCKLFEKHGLTNVGYWVPADKSDNRLVYVISSPNRAAHKKSWQAFLNDPDWEKAYK
ncbi:MAG: NIPSNAP family protein, partial [Roseibacillus sp.]